MKKISFYSVCISLLMTIVVICSDKLMAQPVALSENFTTYDPPNTSTHPVGWIIPFHDNYTSSASSGISGPNSFRFAPTTPLPNSIMITSAPFTNADSVSFWLKAQGSGAIDPANYFAVLKTTDGTNYDTLVKVQPVTATGTTHKYFVSNTVVRLKFVYYKAVAGYNMAFDDVLVSRNVPTPVARFGSLYHCDGDSVQFLDSSVVINGVGNIASWLWDFGEPSSGINNTSTLQNPLHMYATPGTYAVKLKVTDNFNTQDSLTKNIVVNPLPSVDFTYNNNAGFNVMFSDASTISAGSMTSWSWDFGDASTPSTSQNPQHLFPGAATYYTCLTVISNAGCEDEYCDSVTVTDVSVKSVAARKQSISTNPNPAKGRFTLDIPSSENITPVISIFDILGKEVEGISVTMIGSGKYSIDMSAKDAGYYFVRVQNGNNYFTKRVIIGK